MPWIRSELLLELLELSSPAETAKWLTPGRVGPAISVDQTFHFFFDDHDFDESDVGVSLLDQDEVAAIARLKNELSAILKTNGVGDSAYFLLHARWPLVEVAAAEAYALLTREPSV